MCANCFPAHHGEEGGCPHPVSFPVFSNGGDSIACYRIPSLVVMGNGDLLALAATRMVNCRNEGETWPVTQLVDAGPSAYGEPDGRIALLYELGGEDGTRLAISTSTGCSMK